MKLDSAFQAPSDRDYLCLRSFPFSALYKQQPVPLAVPPSRDFAIVNAELEAANPLTNSLALMQWNMLWESAHLRADFFEHSVWPAHREYHPRGTPAEWLLRYRDRTITLLPRTRSMYNAFGPLYQLMPRAHLQRFDLPALNDPVWPAPLITDFDNALPFDFLARFERAFAAFIWPFLTDDRRRAFSRDYPLQLLASDLEYWITAVRLNRCPCPKNPMFTRLRAIIFWCRFEIASEDILQGSPSSSDRTNRALRCADLRRRRCF